MKNHQHCPLVSVALLKPVLACLLALSSSAGQAAIIADFSGGAGNGLPDQFIGTAGEGWAGAWNTRNGSGGTTTFTVLDTDPFGAEGGNYLQVDYVRTTAGGSNRSGVARAFDTAGSPSVDLTKPYTISFEFRVDALMGFNSSGDQIAFSSESTTTVGGFGTDAPWSLLIRGDTGWIVSNGDGVGGISSNLNFSSLGLTSLSTNTIYSIKVFVDPANFGYDLTITTGGQTYRASDLNGGNLLGFRTNTTAGTANVLQFRATNNDIGDEIKWSLDNIAVVPEPSTSALLLGGILWVGHRFRRGEFVEKTSTGR